LFHGETQIPQVRNAERWITSHELLHECGNRSSLVLSLHWIGSPVATALQRACQQPAMRRLRKGGGSLAGEWLTSLFSAAPPPQGSGAIGTTISDAPLGRGSCAAVSGSRWLLRPRRSSCPTPGAALSRRVAQNRNLPPTGGRLLQFRPVLHRATDYEFQKQFLPAAADRARSSCVDRVLVVVELSTWVTRSSRNDCLAAPGGRCVA